MIELEVRVKYADIIVDISLEALDKIFQYIVPERLMSEIRVGSQVTVVNEIAGNLIVQVKESRLALDKTMANRIMVG